MKMKMASKNGIENEIQWQLAAYRGGGWRKAGWRAGESQLIEALLAAAAQHQLASVANAANQLSVAIISISALANRLMQQLKI